MANKELVLKGDNKQMAQQLFDYMKDHEVSLEVIEKVMPFQIQFIKELCSLFQKVVDNEKELSKEHIKAIQSCIEALSEATKDNAIDSSEKHSICQMIYELGKTIAELEEQRQSDSHKEHCLLYAILAAIVGFFFLIVTGKLPNGGGSQNA